MDLPDPGIEPTSLVSAALAGELFTTSAIVSVHAIYTSTHGFINGYTVFLLGESQGRGSLVGCRLWGRTEVDMTEATQQQQQQQQQHIHKIWNVLPSSLYLPSHVLDTKIFIIGQKS